ncbi:MAG: FAD-dependent oxidoreductase [Oligoflexia bacterium]|nr:FAD-dependent oxidoreductase [Oligoflexia bacterium]
MNTNANANKNDNNNLIPIVLNDKEVKVPVGITILEAAKLYGIEIPTLCYNHRTHPFTSCFLCVVEVEKHKNLPPACATKVAPGMVIKTNSPKVMDTRKMALDLMLSDHAGDCVAPCHLHCPARTDVQGYVAHIANGDYISALKLIKSRLALPVICGTICPNPCEKECRRGLVDEPIAIRALKRFASELDLKEGAYMPSVAADTGKKIAIVGGGPAGLAAAYYLRQEGHEVHIYEELPLLGGMTRYGIPKFRLPWDKMDAEINSIIGLGVHTHMNKKLGRDFTITDLRNEGFNAILIAVGAQGSKPMGVDKERVPGVIGGVDFLRRVVMGENFSHPKKVAVIGGGDVAMDCARVARRLGSNVSLLYRRTQAEMPALPHEQHETEEEGVHFKFLVAPLEVITDNGGRANGLKVNHMQLGEPDSSGRRKPVAIPGSEEILPFDLIISAIGQDPDLSFLERESDQTKLNTTKWKTIVYDAKTMCTSIPGVFTAGDCAFGPDTVVRALSEGYQAAKSIHLYLGGNEIKFNEGSMETSNGSNEEYHISRGRIAELSSDDFSPRFEHKKRALETIHPAEKRLSNDGGYAPINVALNNAKSIAEATRCIECGCSARYSCDLRKYATEYGSSEKIFVGEKRKYEVDNRHPLIRFEADKCITCGNCVRLCGEVRKISALTFVNRGFKTHVAPNFEDALQTTKCDACGMCIDVCPTGAITFNNKTKEEGPWPLDFNANKTITSCIACARGCALNVTTVEGNVVKVQSVDHDPINGALICAEGRFAYKMMRDLKELSEKDVMKAIATAKKALAAGATGAAAKAATTAIVVSPFISIEDCYALSVFAKVKKSKIYYLTVSKDKTSKSYKSSQPSYPGSKLDGEFNSTILKMLGATAINVEKSADVKKLHGKTLLVVNTCLDSKIIPASVRAKTKIISISNFDSICSQQKVLANISCAESMECKGSYLNIDGKLTLLNCIGNCGCSSCHPFSISTIVSHLGSTAAEEKELKLLADIKDLRHKFAHDYPVLRDLLDRVDGIQSANYADPVLQQKTRVLESNLKVSSASIEKAYESDTRKLAFDKYIKDLGLGLDIRSKA